MAETAPPPPLRRLLLEARDRHLAVLAGLSDYRFLTQSLWTTLLKEASAGRVAVDWSNPDTGSRFDAARAAEWADPSLTKLNEECFRRSLAAFEFGLFELLRLWLVRDPAKIADRQLRISALYLAGDLDEAKDVAVLSALDDLKYKRLDEWFRFLAETIRRNDVVDGESLRLLAEMKARRDVLEHNAGFANDLYVNKVTRAGAAPRYAAGERVVITDDDFQETTELIRKVLGDSATLATVRAGEDDL